MEIEEIEFNINIDAHKNRNTLKCQLLEGVELENSKAFVVYLDDKTKNIPSVEFLIIKHVLHRSTIYYSGKKEELDITRLKEYYSISFARIGLGKKLWDEIRSSFVKSGLKQLILAESYINRYMCYKRYPNNTLHQFLREISFAYPLNC